MTRPLSSLFPAGTSGTSGITGTSGTSGDAGTGGTSGTAGTSGTSGMAMSRDFVVVDNGETKDVSIFDITVYRTIQWIVSINDTTNNRIRSETITAHHDNGDTVFTRFGILGNASVTLTVVETGGYIRLQATASADGQRISTVNIGVYA